MEAHRLDGHEDAIVWFHEGAWGFSTPTWMGLECRMLESISAPRNLVGLPSLYGVTLSWDYPESKGGMVIDGFLLYLNSEIREFPLGTSFETYMSRGGVYSISLAARSGVIIGHQTPAQTLDLSYDLSITHPADGSTICSGTVTITWSYSEGAVMVEKFLVEVNGEAVSLSGDARSHSVELAAGPQQITVTAVDAHDLECADGISFTVESPPSAPQNLVIVPGFQGVELSWEQAVVPGEMEVDGYMLFVNGVSTEVPLGLSHSLALIPGEAYSISMAACSGDITGPQTQTQVIDLSYALAITHPADGATEDSGTVTITWSYSEGVAIVDQFRIEVNGESKLLAGDARSYSVDLGEGSHKITVTALDKNGAELVEEASFTLESPSTDLPLAALASVAVVALLALGLAVWRFF